MRVLGKMIPSNYEYFGPEQHNADMKNIVANTAESVRIIGQVKGHWDGELDAVVAMANKEVITEREDHSDYLYTADISNSTPTLHRIAKVIGFTSNTQTRIQMQRPGCNHCRHRDPAERYANPYRVQVLVALAPWEYGQCLFFNDTIVDKWQAGDVIYSEFHNIDHFTTNASWHTRPLLHIIGEPGESLKQLLAIKEKHIFQL